MQEKRRKGNAAQAEPLSVTARGREALWGDGGNQHGCLAQRGVTGWGCSSRLLPLDASPGDALLSRVRQASASRGNAPCPGRQRGTSARSHSDGFNAPWGMARRCGGRKAQVWCPLLCCKEAGQSPGVCCAVPQRLVGLLHLAGCGAARKAPSISPPASPAEISMV